MRARSYVCANWYYYLIYYARVRETFWDNMKGEKIPPTLT